MKRRSVRCPLTILLVLVGFVCSLPAWAEELRLALVVGNGKYQASPLANPVNDAGDMANALQRLGFSVILKQNAGLMEMEDAVRTFGDRLKKGGVGLFYYAGHGVQIGGRNYLVPVGARIQKETDVKYQALDVEMILDEMGNAGNPINIVILDACRDNPFARSFRSATRGLAIIPSAPRGTFITYSTSPGKVAADGTGRNSPYAEALLRHMARPNIPIEEVFKKVRQDLGKKTKGQQTPWELSSLEGSFYFRQAGRVSVAAPPADADYEAEKRRLEEERLRLQREKALLAEQKALAEERRLLEEQRRKMREGSERRPGESSGQAAGTVLFYDDFSGPRHGWPVYENGQHYDTYFRDSKYFMETKNERKSLEIISIPPQVAGNYDIDLTTIWQKGVNDSAYGLILGEGRKSYYLFGISGNGQSVVWVTADDVSVDDAMKWRTATAKVSDGKYVENAQRVEVRGDQLSYYVNGTFLIRIKNRFPLKSFGVAVSRQQKVAFIQIKITQR